MASSPITSWQIDGKKVETVTDYFLGSRVTVDGDCIHEIKIHLLLGRKAMTNLDSILKYKDHFTDKGPYNQSCGFSSSHVWMWELDHKEGWVPKNWCFWIVVLEKTLESPLDCKKIKPINPKGNQSWIFIGRTDAEAEIPILWPPAGQRANSLEKTLRLGKFEGKRRRGQQRMRWLDSIIDSMDKLQETVKDREPGVLQSMRSQRVRHNWATEQNHNLHNY